MICCQFKKCHQYFSQLKFAIKLFYTNPQFFSIKIRESNLSNYRFVLPGARPAFCTDRWRTQSGRWRAAAGSSGQRRPPPRVVTTHLLLQCYRLSENPQMPITVSILNQVSLHYNQRSKWIYPVPTHEKKSESGFERKEQPDPDPTSQNFFLSIYFTYIEMLLINYNFD